VVASVQIRALTRELFDATSNAKKNDKLIPVSRNAWRYEASRAVPLRRKLWRWVFGFRERACVAAEWDFRESGTAVFYDTP